MDHKIRLAQSSDAVAILRIYAPYVRDTAISFETEVPSIDAFAARMEAICGQYPYLVCETGGQIVGYAYASRHRERAAYRYDADLSVYLSPACQGRGLARWLYGCLYEILLKQGLANVYAGVTQPNQRSMAFHLKEGFAPIGVYRQTGWKFGKWHDVAWLGKTLRDLSRFAPGDVLPVGELSESWLEELFREQNAQGDSL